MNKETVKYLEDAMEEMTYEVKIEGKILTRTDENSCGGSVGKYEITNEKFDIQELGIAGTKVKHNEDMEDYIKPGCQRRMMPIRRIKIEKYIFNVFK